LPESAPIPPDEDGLSPGGKLDLASGDLPLPRGGVRALQGETKPAASAPSLIRGALTYAPIERAAKLACTPDEPVRESVKCR